MKIFHLATITELLILGFFWPLDTDMPSRLLTIWSTYSFQDLHKTAAKPDYSQEDDRHHELILHMQSHQIPDHRLLYPDNQVFTSDEVNIVSKTKYSLEVCEYVIRTLVNQHILLSQFTWVAILIYLCS